MKIERQAIRLFRQGHHQWQVRVEDDLLITRNIVNLSAAGIAFKAPLWSAFEPGQRLRLNLSLNRDMSFNCEGKVVWIKNTHDHAGDMQVLGIEFSKLPVHVDSTIMKHINDDLLNERRELISRGISRVDDRTGERPFTLKRAIHTAAGALMAISLTASLVAAVYLHQKNHPENSISSIFIKALNKKILATGDATK